MAIPMGEGQIMATRYFEYSGERARSQSGSSEKFWEITITGCDITVRFGKLGVQGQSKTKTFSNTAAAKEELTKMIGEKTKKGYVEKK